jgi:natural product biosynthesis luciferase-like monooxygenase protein
MVAYTFLRDGEEEEESLTYGELDRRARAVAAELHARGARGERVLLLYPPGLEFTAAFLGCLYAGAVGVPAYPPRQNRNALRLWAIVSDARAKFALTTPTIRSRIEKLPDRPAELAAAHQWLTADDAPAVGHEGWRGPELAGDDLAFLQYTSGSTGAPKGVMLTHENLLCNAALVYRAVGHTPEDKYVSWLPTFHDMGFMAGLLQPLYGGLPCVLMSPASFLQRPSRWLRAISRHKATTTGGPNFAYDLCVRRVTPEQRAELDLRSWSVAFNGSEKVRPETLERFAEAFAPCGFRREAFYPCYGLAEATLMVSGGRKGAPPVIKAASATALKAGAAAAPAGDEKRQLLVGCGETMRGQTVAVVNPETLSRCAPGEVGEIWVSGRSVAQGYWNRPDETERTFRARLSDGGGPYLRTGDLGFLDGGELFITGRLKDVIIIRGFNHYPDDIEKTVERCHPALRPGGGAAFSVEAEGEERLVVVHELEHRQHAEPDAVVEAVREAVAEEHEVQVYAVALIRAGSIPKTSSGKIQRRACRELFLSGGLDVLHERRATVAPGAVAEAEPAPATPMRGPGDIESWLVSRLAAGAGIAAAEVDVNRPIVFYGLDSLAAIELTHGLEEGLGVVVPMASFLRSPSIAELAAHAYAQLAADGSARAPRPGASADEPTEYPLSHGQQALWFLHRLSPESPAYNIAAAFRIGGALNVAALRRAFEVLAGRHACLRTTFSAPGGRPLQRVGERAEVYLEEFDASALDEASLDARIADEALRPFDLERGPLLRLCLFARAGGEHVLLLTVHHIVADYWSLAVLVRELQEVYEAEASGVRAAPAPPPLRYSDFVRWQSEMLAGAEGARLWSFWSEQLAGELPVLNLPTDRPRPAVQGYGGAALRFQLGEPEVERLREVGRAQGATLYSVLLAAFQVLLYRYTGQEEIIVGSPAAGRVSAQFSGVVGYFVNPVVLRADLSGRPTFEEFLARVRTTVLAALEHQDYPFTLLVEKLQLARDPSRSPVFQAMFIWQKSHLPADEAPSSNAAGSDRHARPAGLGLEPLPLAQQVAQFDLTLTVSESRGAVTASLEYSTDLFEAATIERMAGHYQTLLRGIAARPAQRVSDLPLLTEGERRQLLTDWNATERDFPEERCVHELFEQQAERTPDAAAVVFEDEQLTYGELNRRANRLANHLRRLGVGPESRVGICVGRSTELVVGLLGILKAGGAYVPLDPEYPQGRLGMMLEEAGLAALVTQRRTLTRLPPQPVQTVCLDSDRERVGQESDENPVNLTSSNNLAYVIYTSGSTGRPKGVMLCHRGVVNFFVGMDERLGCRSSDTLLAVTSVSFDISVLELLWTLARGARVVILGEQAASPAARRGGSDRRLQFSLFYFASDDSEATGDKYRLLLEGAKFADRHGFTAVWTPERHFHAFGGLYPNPSVVSAALATVTERVQLRGGSVVLPLHHPIRVAEEWSVVDNLSKGRVGLAFASGWHADDFVFFPENYASRKEVMVRAIEAVQRLWQGGSVAVRGGSGNEFEARIFPKPIQPKLPVWLTAAGAPETFAKAGELGVNVLTHLLGQSLEDVAERIKLYRDARARHGHDPESGHVTLMLHTFVGESREEVREKVRAPFTNYLRSSIGLIANLIKSLNLPVKLESMSAKDTEDLLAFAFDRYFETSALFGSPETCAPVVEDLKALGVDEVACLIDFGVDVDSTLANLRRLDELKELSERGRSAAGYSLASQARRHGATLLQCTPTMMRMFSVDADALSALQSLRLLMLGGEALPPSLARQVEESLPARAVNMYGPTETTIWSATYDLGGQAGDVAIGRPIANTRLYLLDRHANPVPVGVTGELYIGGDGLARGYFRHPGLTAERFVPDPFGPEPGRRMYRTGDLARYRPDGNVEFLGRVDQQVKLRGFRIELEEIEAALNEHPTVREAVVSAREDAQGDKRLVAYVVPAQPSLLKVGELRNHLRRRLPDYMVPAAFVLLEALPLTSNGKVNRKALPDPGGSALHSRGGYAAPRSDVERAVAAIWQQALGVEKVGRYDNFFELGGHSLLMVQVHSQLREAFGKEVPIIKLLEHPTVSSLSKFLAEEQAELPSFETSRERARKQRESLLRVRQNAGRSRK